MKKNQIMFEKINDHFGHSIVIARYNGYSKGKKVVANVAIECEDCNEVIYDIDNPSYEMED